jgi:hypothetical protein
MSIFYPFSASIRKSSVSCQVPPDKTGAPAESGKERDQPGKNRHVIESIAARFSRFHGINFFFNGSAGRDRKLALTNLSSGGMI